MFNGFIHENILTVNASVHPVFGPHICPSPSRPNAKWASGPRSPLAPTVPFSGTSDTQPAKQKQNFAFILLEFFNHYNFGSLIGSRLFPADIYLLKVNNRNTRAKCETGSKLIIKTSERRQWRRSGAFIVNFEHISHFVLVFLLLTLNI